MDQRANKHMHTHRRGAATVHKRMTAPDVSPVRVFAVEMLACTVAAAPSLDRSWVLSKSREESSSMPAFGLDARLSGA